MKFLKLILTNYTIDYVLFIWNSVIICYILFIFMLLVFWSLLLCAQKAKAKKKRTRKTTPGKSPKGASAETLAKVLSLFYMDFIFACCKFVMT